MKQTAVEWLVEQLKEYKHLSYNEQYWIFKQAKEMEKEQIINSFNQGYTQCSIEDLKPTSRKRYEDAEQYYNETFKSE
jgi:hypothetical protein